VKNSLDMFKDCVTKRIQGAWGLAVGGLTPGTHGGLHGPHREGWSSPQDSALRSIAELSMHRKAVWRHRDDFVESVRTCQM
jgi:hypothetical protein